jgi:hypothetical protein
MSLQKSLSQRQYHTGSRGDAKHIYCTQPPPAEVTKLLCPHHEGAGSPHPIRVGGPDLWYQMALVDTTVDQSLPAEGTRGA